MVRVERQDEDWLGIAVAALGGLAAGLAAGVVIGEMLGDMSPGRLKGTLATIRHGGRRTPKDPGEIRRAVESALDDNPDLGDLSIDVTAHEDGIVELTGVAPDDLTRELAGEVARGVSGTDVVVNRVLVEGVDVKEQG
ncbi:MAG: BON domain-containing protein [Gemmatimonadales bacterium]